MKGFLNRVRSPQLSITCDIDSKATEKTRRCVGCGSCLPCGYYHLFLDQERHKNYFTRSTSPVKMMFVFIDWVQLAINRVLRRDRAHDHPTGLRRRRARPLPKPRRVCHMLNSVEPDMHRRRHRCCVFVRVLVPPPPSYRSEDANPTKKKFAFTDELEPGGGARCRSTMKWLVVGAIIDSAKS